MSEPHEIRPNDPRSWLDLYRENEGLRQQLREAVSQLNDLEVGLTELLNTSKDWTHDREHRTLPVPVDSG